MDRGKDWGRGKGCITPGDSREVTPVKSDFNFFNLYQHGFIRVALGVPEVQVADPPFNAAKTVELMERAAAEKALLVLFPELGFVIVLLRRSVSPTGPAGCFGSSPAHCAAGL